MKVSALEPWAGSKRTLAPLIVETLGEHGAYFEPFCGSMSVLLAKPRCTMETVNDLHGDLINIARVIQHPKLGPKLYRHLRRTLFCQEFFNDVVGQFRAEGLRFDVPPELDWERAARFAIFSWFGRNGTIGTDAGNNFCVRYTSNGGQPATRWRNWVGSIPWFHRRLQGVIILRECGFEMLERIEDKPGTVVYEDPPYIQKTFRYEYDFADGDHERLAELNKRFKHTKVVLSYYDHPDLERLYPSWEKINCAITKGLVSAGMRGKEGPVKAPEVLLVNRVSLGCKKKRIKAAIGEGLFA